MRQSSERKPASRGRMFFGAAVGNFIEWYEFGVYGFLAVYIGQIFFPTASESAQLLSSFAVFGVSFFVRPLGGMYFGPLCDRVGRKPVLLIVLTIMASSTTAIGLLPSHATIGVAAPVLLVAMRLIQGFSAGGEFGTNTTFIAEHAAPSRRGLSASLVPLSASAGVLTGGVVVYLLTAAVGEDSMLDWGWRVPFLIAAPLGVFGLYIRLALEDTPEFKELEQSSDVEKRPLRALWAFRRSVLVTAGIASLYGVSYYFVVTYLPSYFTKIVGLTSDQALLIVLAAGVLTLVVFPLAGMLSDVIGRRPVLIASAVAHVVLAVPLFALMQQGSVASALTGTLILAGIMAPFVAVSISTMAESFPTAVRATGISVSFNFTLAIFGGLAPFTATYLIEQTDNITSPAWYLMLAAVIALISLAVWRPDHSADKRIAETAPTDGTIVR